MQTQITGRPDNQRGRSVLALRPQRTENLLASISGIEVSNIDEIRRFSNALIAARDRWADENRCGRRYSDAQEARTFGTVFKSGGAR